MAQAPSDPNFMMSLQRGLEVLRAFENRAQLTVGQVAKITGLPRPSAGRCLYTLVALGYLSEQDGTYGLTPAFLPLSTSYLSSNPLARAAQPVVNAVRDKLGESSSLAVLDERDGNHVIYVCRAETARIISVPLNIGSTLPSYCTSIGRVLLAALDEPKLQRYLSQAPFPPRTQRTQTEYGPLQDEIARVRAQGWALLDEELELGLRSIAVPVHDRQGRTVAALNAGAQTRSWSAENLIKTALPELRAAAAHLARTVQ